MSRDRAAQRRSFLKAAGFASGGAWLETRVHAQHPQATNAHTDKPDDEAFRGVLVAPQATRSLNQRKNIAFLPASELDQLREAFRILRANNDQIYNTWVNVHANNCQHNNNLIWPWHRAYLYYFERRLQAALPGANPVITLPYWNYDRVGNGTGTDTVEFRRLPAPYRPQSVNSQPNSLWVNRRANVNNGSYSLPFAAVRTDSIVAGNPMFFNYSVNIENQPHNNVHNSLGTPMNDRFFSPRDPVFWLHHSNLDRAWEAWRAVPGHQDLLSPSLAAWRRTPLPGFTGASFPRRLVGDFLSLDELGYTYVDQMIELVLKPGATAKSISTSDLDFAAAKKQPQPSPETRPVRVRFEEVQPVRAVLQVRVFLGVPNASPETSLDDPGFVGMFTLYPPHADHGAADSSVTLDLDATDAIRRQSSEKKTTRFPVTIVVVSSAEEGRANAPAAAELKYKRAYVLIGD